MQLDKSLDLAARPAYLSSNSRRSTRTSGGSGNGGVMHRYVAFLRGVNPMNARMAELRRCFETAGFTDVRTVLSSGNVAFGAPAKSDTALARIGNTKPLFPRHPFRPPPPAAAARAQLGLARLSALDRPLRMGEAEASSVSGAQGGIPRSRMR